MSKGLIVVESPAKVKTIQKFVGEDYLVKASLGHVKDLPEGELGVDLQKDFQPQYVSIPGKKKVLSELKQAGVNLLACSGFPARAGKAQLDFALEKPAISRKLAKKHGWPISKVKKAFLIQGADQAGAVHRHVQKLAAGRINVTAATAVSAGQGRYGMVLWVKPKDYNRAAKLLAAK